MDLEKISLKNIIYMKYGVHASEGSEEIVLRKKKEINDNGWTLWGYGGTICHPTNQVQPFVKKCMEKGEKVYVVMQSTKSQHKITSNRKKYYSKEKPDKKSPTKQILHEIPKSIDVYGSNYALCIKDLNECNFELDLNTYEVAVGKSIGKNLGEYIMYRTDKGCATRTEKANIDNLYPVTITLIAEIIDPYAVFVRQ